MKELIAVSIIVGVYTSIAIAAIILVDVVLDKVYT